jgi:hypothetical protein
MRNTKKKINMIISNITKKVKGRCYRHDISRVTERGPERRFAARPEHHVRNRSQSRQPDPTSTSSQSQSRPRKQSLEQITISL